MMAELLSEELKAQLGGDEYGANVEGDDPNAAIIVPAPKPEPAPAVRRPLTGRQKKRLNTLAERLAKQEARPALYASLSKNAIPADQLRLMHGASTLGQKETMKQKLKRALNEEKAGIAQSDPSVHLYQKRSEADGAAPELQPKEVVESASSKKKRRKKAKALKEKGPQVRQPAKRFAFGLQEKNDDDEEEEDKGMSDSASEEVTEVKEKRSKTENAAKVEASTKKPNLAVTVPQAPAPAAASSSGGGSGFVIPDVYLKSAQPKKEGRLVLKRKAEEARAREEEKKKREEEEEEEVVEEKEEEEQKEEEEADGNDGEEEEKEGEEEEDEEEDGDDEGEDEDEDDEDEEEEEEEEVEAQAKEVDPLLEPGLFRMGQLQGVEQFQENPSVTLSADVVTVHRSKEIQEQRSKLPIMNEEGTILEAVKENDVLVLCGETGSGKTTQVPQFLYEAGYTRFGRIGVTEPRRVAAVSVAERVKKELGSEKGVVAYQIRYDNTVASQTRIKFMTDGILLKELQEDFALRQYSVLILDEAHERSLNTDILLGLLSRVVPLRRKMHLETAELAKDKIVSPLKLIIMSATLRVQDFTENRRLFPSPPPVIKVESRQFSVTIHFNRKTADDYVGEAFSKVCKIHRTLPPGAILVFLTGQGEIDLLCRKLRNEFPVRAKELVKKETKKGKSDEQMEEIASERQQEEEEVNEKPQEEEKAEEGKDSDDEEEEEGIEKEFPPLQVLPLYSLLATDQQMRVFQPPPPGVRLCVVATNVAETSLTIPGVKYVVDSGRAKERFFDRATGIARFEVSWISQAAANQRAGRAGRTEEGHCYRLYSSAVFSDFAKFGEPEILRMPVDSVVLQMKSMGIENVVTFPFATPPPREAITSAIKTLSLLGALETTEPNKATPLGQALAALPVPPRSGKLLVNAKGMGCLNLALALAALLSVSTDPIMRREAAKEADENATEEEKEKIREEAAAALTAQRQWSHPTSDLLGLLKAYGAFEYAGCTESFCHANALHYKTMKEVHDLRLQLHSLLKSVLPDVTDAVLDLSRPPSDAQTVQLRQLLLGSYFDQVAKLSPIPSGRNQPHVSNRYVTLSGNDAFIHPTSSLVKDLPSFVIYRELLHTTKPFMRGVTVVNASWFSALAPAFSKASAPLDNPPPKYHAASDSVRCYVNMTYGPHSWALPMQEIDFPEGAERVKHFARLLLEGEVFTRLTSCKI